MRDRGPPLSSAAWFEFAGNGSQNVRTFKTWIKGHSALKLAKGFTLDEAKVARTFIKEIREWLDELEDSLPAEAKK